jgi:predicted MFS family arabinose efflux permease
VLTTTGSATRMGVVMAVSLVPVALFGVVAGTVIDRLGPRRVMLASDGCRALLVSAIPLLYAVHLLSFPVLLALAFAQGCFGTVYGPSQRVVLPSLVTEDERTVGQANAFIQGADRVSGLAGPALAGLLILLLAAPLVLLLDGLSYALSFGLLVAGLPRRAEVAEVGGGRPHILEGLRYAVRDPLLGPLAGAVTVLDAGFAALVAAMPVLVIVRYHGDPRLVGIFLSAFSGGALAGTGLLVLLGGRFGALAMAGVGLPAMALPLWLLVPDVPWPVVAAALLLSGAANAFVSAPLYTAVTLRVPAAIRNQVMTTVNSLITVAGPIGLALTGRGLDTLGVVPVLVIIAALSGAAAGVATVAVQTTRRREAREAAEP